MWIIRGKGPKQVDDSRFYVHKVFTKCVAIVKTMSSLPIAIRFCDTPLIHNRSCRPDAFRFEGTFGVPGICQLEQRPNQVCCASNLSGVQSG